MSHQFANKTPETRKALETLLGHMFERELREMRKVQKDVTIDEALTAFIEFDGPVEVTNPCGAQGSYCRR